MRVERRELEALARRLYRGGPAVMRKMAHWRIAICPFDRIVGHVGEGASVLDAGCGSGVFLGFLAGTVKGLKGVGFDASPMAIETARRMAERARELGLEAELRFERRDAGAEWPEGTYDVVSLVDVLHHVKPERQRAVIEKAAGRAKAGGMLLYKDMAERPLWCAWLNRLHDLVVAREWIYYAPVGRVEEWAREVGLVVEHAEGMGRLWYRHDLRIFRKPAT
jgi:2-polyprenyl-3-methyl-5-hydroxy-6-metoxy-1,4-benzoquinol methylase